MKNKNGFTLVELIVSFALITTISLLFFRTTLTLQKEQMENVAKNSFKAFTIVLNNSIQKDFLNNNIEKIISCGDSCYDIIYTTKGIVRLKLDKETNTITYGDISEKIPNEYKLMGDIEFTSYINSYEGNDSYIALNMNLKSNYESKIENIKYVYQYDSDKNMIVLDVDGVEASGTIEYLLYSSPDENGLYEPLLPDGTSTGIRYRGENPNNYVYFNCKETDGTNQYGSEDYKYDSSCEMWRIIGVFEEEDGEGNKAKRIKIVRNDVLPYKERWQLEEGVNQWGKSTYSDGTLYEGVELMRYLNGDTDEGYYYSLSQIAKNQISEVLWHTGAINNGTASEIYASERSNASRTGTTVNYTSNWLGKIGLINASDFAYAGLGCLDKTINESCDISKNWLTPTNYQYWTITADASSSDKVWHTNTSGTVTLSGLNVLLGVYPSVYLNADVKIIGADGIGTEDNPYILGISE